MNFLISMELVDQCCKQANFPPAEEERARTPYHSISEDCFREWRDLIQNSRA